MLAPNGFTPKVAAIPGTSGAPNQQTGAPDTLSLMKSLINTAGKQPNYDPVYNNIYEDKTLAEFKAQSGENSEESVAYFRTHASQYVVQFVTECRVYRHGPFQSTFRDLVDNYHLLNQINSQVKREFTTVLTGRIDLMDTIALRTSIWFGFIVANILKTSNNSSPNRAAILQAVQTAAINILNIELVLWIHGSNKGKQFLYNPTPEIAELLANFNKRRNAAEAVWQFFEDNSPYTTANFMDDKSMEGAAQSIMPELTTANIRQRIVTPNGMGMTSLDGNFIPDFSETTTDEQRELMMIPFNNLRARNNYTEISQTPPMQHRPDMHSDYEVYGSQNSGFRTDIHSITPKNRHLFDVRSYFRKTGLENWWVVNEDDWIFLRSALKRSSKQRMEETLVRYCERLVHYDFSDESEGWTSRSIRFKGIDASMILSDPAKLLPLLTDPGFDPETAVKVMDAKQFFDEEGKKFGPDAKVFDELRESGFEYRIIQSDEKLESENTAKVMERLHVMGHTLTLETQQSTALFNDFDVLGRLLFSDKQKRDSIEKRFPMFFHGNDYLDDHSYFSAVNEISKSFARAPVDDNTVDEADRFDVYVERRMTTDLNNWLINACGYSVKAEDGAQLSVDNIFQDVEALKKELLVKDKEVYDALNQSGRCCLLKEQMKLFDPILEAPEGLSALERTEHELSLYRRKNYTGIIICNQSGPRPTKDKTIILRRSVYPEFFLLIDQLKKDLPLKGRSLDSENIMIMYKNSNDLFMVTQTVYDENVVTLRTIVPRRTLLNPAYG